MSYKQKIFGIFVTAKLNLNSTSTQIGVTTQWPGLPTTHPTHETLCCCCAAGRVTIGDSKSLLTTYRATVNVVTTKNNLPLV